MFEENDIAFCGYVLVKIISAFLLRILSPILFLCSTLYAPNLMAGCDASSCHSLTSFMGRGVVNAPMEKVQAYLADFTTRHEYDPMCTVCDVTLTLL